MSPAYPGIRPLLLFLGIATITVLVAAGVVIFMDHERGSAREGKIEVIRPPHDVEALIFWNHTLVAGGRDGVFFIDPASNTMIGSLPVTPPPAFTQALLVDPSGTLWVGHDSGIMTWDNSSVHVITTRDGLPEGRVLSLLTDPGGSIFAGSTHGLVRRTGGGWSVTSTAEGLINPVVNVLFRDNTGALWTGSYDAPRGGVSILDEGRWAHFSIESGLPHPNICAICEADNGSVWVGTGLFNRGGAAEFVRREGAWTINRTLHRDDGLAGEKVRSCYFDSSGRLWFGSEYDGVAWLDAGGWHRLTTQDGLSHDEVKVILEGPDGSIWLGTRDGVTRIRPAALAGFP